MKSSIIALASLALVLSACGGGQKIGDEDILKGVKAPPKSSPPPTKKPPTKKPPTKKPPTKTAAPAPGFKPFKLYIRSLGGGFEPSDRPRVCVGQKVIFQNLDPQNVHAWNAKNGEWKSGDVKYQDTFELVVQLAPGNYDFVDKYPYIYGTMEVLKC